MTMTTITREDITCKELVELVTEYLDGALPAEDHAFFAQHIAGCDGCAVYVDQIRLTIAAAGKVTENSIAPAVRAELLAAFRGWHNRNDQSS
jgi:anti-sigma factor RsiW